MKVELVVLVFLLLGACQLTQGRAQPVEGSPIGDGQHLDRRYAESTIASDMSKIMDSMVQKNFVNFLLSQKEKRSVPTTMQDSADIGTLNDLLRKEFIMWVHNEAERSKEN